MQSRTFFPLVAVLMIAGCAGAEDAAPTASAAETGESPIGAIQGASLAARPGETAYRCADGRVAMAEFIEGIDEIGLRVGRINAVLEPTRAASGVRYQAGGVVFWTKGDEATLETPGAAPTICQQT
jgi:membrane-bound inhibitor of C-type lysozyme